MTHSFVFDTSTFKQLEEDSIANVENQKKTFADLFNQCTSHKKAIQDFQRHFLTMKKELGSSFKVFFEN